MVSFQCDACTDVVKKPKLDQHRVRCGASFTCIDCSKTFPTPADWKSHTSCISEEQKYQKSLYRPKPNGGGRENQYQASSRSNFQSRGGSWNRPPPRSQATGANGTPLGTPPRMSPVTTPPPVEDEKNSAPAPAAVKVMEQPNGEPAKAHKKRKSEATDAIQTEVELKIKEKKEKKEKKENKNKRQDEAALETNLNGVDSADIALPSTAEPVADQKPKKSKKSKKHEDSVIGTGDAAPDLPGQPSTVDMDVVSGEDKKKKKKKRKSEAANGETEFNGDPSPSTDATSAIPEKKSKKRKREAEVQTGYVTEQADGDTEKKKKKKKKKAAAS